jgi:catechol 1,2-dioxygenase
MGSGASVERSDDGKGKRKDRTLQYDPTFTDRVIDATGPNANPRLAEVMPGLVRHLHDFARESELTVAEWTAAVEFVSQDPRQPGHL